MKKLLLFIALILLISGCQRASTNHIQKDTNLSGIHELNYQELMEKLNSDSLFVLYIGRPDCGDCQEFEPILDDYLANHPGVYLYYLNIKSYRDASLEADASQDEIDFYDNIKEELDFAWTPILKLVNNGETIDEYTYLSQDYYEIKDEDKRIKAKEEYVSDFYSWMSNIFK